MKLLLPAILSIASTVFACGPFFPPSYLNDHPLDSGGDFTENINVPLELLYLAMEYKLVDDRVFTNSSATSLIADCAEFNKAATAIAWTSKIQPYFAYATKVRNGETNAVPPTVPDALKEFILYTEGFREMQADPDLTQPIAWEQLLMLTPDMRRHRTTWVYYMLGNLASSHGQPTAGANYYEACRQAGRDGFPDALGLAHASYKRQHLSQTNMIDRIRYGVQAVAYYRLAGDQNRMTHCLDHLKKDMGVSARQKDPISEHPLCLEASALFRVGDAALIARMEQSPPLKISPRLAWFMYRSGRIDEAETYLASCPESDPLANWLRFRTAQRNGQNSKAIEYLRKWMDELQHSDRIIFSTWERRTVSTPAVIAGNMGKLLVTEGDMSAALDCFAKAGSYTDAALIGERYMTTDSLKAYIDTFNRLAPDYSFPPRYQYGMADQSQDYIRYSLSNLLARRLFREDRMQEARSYYAPQWADLLDDYLNAVAQSEDTRLSRDIRAAYLYQAARIMRWKGMELSGTALAPDYTITAGLFNHAGIYQEARVAGEKGTDLYERTEPDPNVRFHYRYYAVELADKAAQLTRNRHQRAAILWSAGAWLKGKYPDQADIYYKQLATIRFQPLAKAADEQRWFPPATPELEAVFRSEAYVPPKTIADAARNYVMR